MGKSPLFLLLFLLPVRAYSMNRTTPESSSSRQGEESREYEEIRSRLMTDMFFSGELADAIMENGRQAGLANLSGREDRAKTREQLILWIRSNPETAADIYFGVRRNPSGAGAEIAQRVVRILSWEVNPRFQAMVDDLEAASRSEKIPGEALAAEGRRIFEGNSSGKGAVMRVPETGKTAAIWLPAFDWKLNPASAAEEQKQAGQWLYGLKSALRRDEAREMERLLGENLPPGDLTPEYPLKTASGRRMVGGRTAAAAVSEKLREREKSVENVSASLRDFIIKCSGLAGRKNLSKTEAAGLEKNRTSLRRALLRAHALALADSVDSRYGIIENTVTAGRRYSGQGRLLKLEKKALRERFLSVSLAAREESVPLAGIYAGLARLEKDELDWRARLALYTELLSLKKEIADTLGCGALERIFRMFFSRFAPGSSRSQRLRRLEALKTGVSEALEAAERGDFSAAYNLLAGTENEKIPAPEEIGKLAEGARLSVRTLKKTADLSRNIQFAFWDSFMCPVGLVTPALIIARSAAAR